LPQPPVLDTIEVRFQNQKGPRSRNRTGYGAVVKATVGLSDLPLCGETGAVETPTSEKVSVFLAGESLGTGVWKLLVRPTGNEDRFEDRSGEQQRRRRPCRTGH
jgi:hypothetical protein